MNINAFVICVNNDCNMDQSEMYVMYLKFFNVIDAIMCGNGDCLAVCVGGEENFKSQVNISNNVQIVESAPYEHLTQLLDKIYDVVELFDTI